METNKLPFYKYQGTGNDFILIDNRSLTFPKNDTKLVARLCDRKFGIGADGLMLLEGDESSDFRMVYFNADGREGSMCGNGGRCMVDFAHHLGIITDTTTFMAVDGLHTAQWEPGYVQLQMQDVADIKEKPQYIFLDTGSPHHVQLVEDIEAFDVRGEGRKLRYGLYGESGSNINFVQQLSDSTFAVRTYERGVEAETLSCGTGVTAVALGMHNLGKTRKDTITLKTMGGILEVGFKLTEAGYSDITLKGPVSRVYEGIIEI
ncbi:diaminopimelate epimerase [Lentiprolixibacter aurantiacus]|uniref:Diaminopimelate epimerase n=1 Tax=Lentiprolixibacter aurantiacus TaxID=2993939 RepID=A0AAE3SNN1_9FLAO|nr:diaminopimelate epimerase [Lentiprolixibacter aurantiacus]MCX2719356.1 diaminopimelate epimerase [Lentiprolixibacter aurantiacus]